MRLLFSTNQLRPDVPGFSLRAYATKAAIALVELYNYPKDPVDDGQRFASVLWANVGAP